MRYFLLLCSLMVFTLTACDNSGSSSETSASSSNSETDVGPGVCQFDLEFMATGGSSNNDISVSRTDTYASEKVCMDQCFQKLEQVNPGQDGTLKWTCQYKGQTIHSVTPKTGSNQNAS